MQTSSKPRPEIFPDGVTLRDPLDFPALRQSIYDGVKTQVASLFPLSYGGVRMELGDLDYEDPDTFDRPEQKKALLQDRFLGRRLRGTLRLHDDKDGSLLEEKRVTLMKVPHLTERGTFVHGGSEYSTINQARLLPGVYTRRKSNGELETHFNVARGTGTSFRVRFEPETALYKLDVGQSQLRLYSLLHDLGVSDEQLEKSWGPEVFERNRAAYDSRVFDKAYARMVRKPDPNASREQKQEALRAALDAMQVSGRVLRTNLPNLYDHAKAAAWRVGAEIFRSKAAALAVAHYQQKEAPPELSIEELRRLAVILNQTREAEIDLSGTRADLVRQIETFLDGDSGSSLAALAGPTPVPPTVAASEK